MNGVLTDLVACQLQAMYCDKLASYWEKVNSNDN